MIDRKLIGMALAAILFASCKQVPKQTETTGKAQEEVTENINRIDDFSMNTPEGTTISALDEISKHKLTIIDFWASWCGPCRGEIPTIIELYNKYAGEKFEVLGVATWDEPEDTKAAIEELGIKYPQIMNAQKAGSDAYGIEGIPQIILFGPDGTILRRDLRGEEMVKAVEEALK